MVPQWLGSIDLRYDAMKHKNVSKKEIEDKFAETAFQLNQERLDFLLPQILDLVQKKQWINLQPEYQRRRVWEVVKRSAFIESLLLNIPIPPIFLYENELGRYEVMDGQQRLNTVIDFYNNVFALKGLRKWPELNGRLHKDLPNTLKRGLERRRLSATVLLLQTETQTQAQRGDVRKLVFERLNTGGQPLNHQELRNCLYASPFNDLLIRLADKRLFKKIWEIPPSASSVATRRKEDEIENQEAPQIYSRMLDCQIVLRFFAFRNRDRIKGSVRSMLDKCMEQNLNVSEEDVLTLEKDFENRLKLAHAIFGDHTFRYQDANTGTWKLSQPLYDAVMVSLDLLWDERDTLRAKRAAIVRNVTRLLQNKKAYEVIVGRPNTAKAIWQRISLIKKGMTLR